MFDEEAFISDKGASILDKRDFISDKGGCYIK